MNSMGIRTMENAMPQIPDYIEPITAYRVWRAVWKERKLYSLYTRYTWPSDAVPAKCNFDMPRSMSRLSYQCTTELPPHEKKTPNNCLNSCGFYALKTPYILIDYLHQTGHNVRFAGDLILGAVSIWGKILEYEAGYRAQYAFPKFIWETIRPKEINLLKEIAQNYGIEVFSMTESIREQLLRR